MVSVSSIGDSKLRLTSTDECCFVVEPDTEEEALQLAKDYCHLCRKDYRLSNGNKRILHMGLHILFDNKVPSRSSQPCGFCLRTDRAVCRLHLIKKRNKLPQLDTKRTACSMLVPFSIGNLSKITDGNPCTNYPLPCPVSTCAEVMWRYNLKPHLESEHRLTGERLSTHQKLYEITKQEKYKMKKRWKSLGSMTGKRPTTASGLSSSSQMKISSGHSVRAVFR